MHHVNSCIMFDGIIIFILIFALIQPNDISILYTLSVYLSVKMYLFECRASNYISLTKSRMNVQQADFFNC